jgi:hypothetical protein
MRSLAAARLIALEVFFNSTGIGTGAGIANGADMLARRRLSRLGVMDWRR